MNYTLIAALIIILIAVFRGWKKGLINILIDLVAWVVLLFLVSALRTPVASIMEKTPIYDAIYSQAEAMVYDKIEEAAETSFDVWWEEMTEIVPSNISDDLKSQVLLDVLGVEDINLSNIAISSNALFIDSLVKAIADYIFQSVISIVVFIIALIIVRIAKRTLSKAGRLPLIKSVNGAAGAAVGVVEGLVWVWAAMFIASCMTTSTFGAYVMNDIANSGILVRLYNLNPVVYILNLF